jgi:hypothetical protein
MRSDPLSNSNGYDAIRTTCVEAEKTGHPRFTGQSRKWLATGFYRPSPLGNHLISNNNGYERLVLKISPEEQTLTATTPVCFQHPKFNSEDAASLQKLVATPFHHLFHHPGG